MDRRLRELERQAASGDEEARTRLQYAECRMGQHILRTDQIIEDADIFKASNDVGGCQCGQKLFTAPELCRLGHHRLREASRNVLTYWCTRFRPGVSFNTLVSGEHELSNNPHVGGAGCNFHLTANESCQKGLHFLQMRQGGKVCRNPECNYIDPINCKTHQLSTPRYDNEGTEVCHCEICWTPFTDMQICQQGLHKPDEMSGEKCIRKGCDLFQGGMNLYQAMVASYEATGELEAICRINGRTIAKAEGWNERLKALGIKKPKQDPEKKIRSTKWGKRWNNSTNRASTYSVKVQYTLDDPYDLTINYNVYGQQVRHFYLRQRDSYSKIAKKQKTLWAGNWYLLTSTLAAG
jgi:hypothetical protein